MVLESASQDRERADIICGIRASREASVLLSFFEIQEIIDYCLGITSNCPRQDSSQPCYTKKSMLFALRFKDVTLICLYTSTLKMSVTAYRLELCIAQDTAFDLYYLILCHHLWCPITLTLSLRWQHATEVMAVQGDFVSPVSLPYTTYTAFASFYPHSWIRAQRCKSPSSLPLSEDKGKEIHMQCEQ